MKVNDAITGIIFLVIGILAFVHAGTFRTMPGVPFGPGLFPSLIAVMMGLGGIILIVNGLRTARYHPWVRLEDWARRPRSYVIFFATIGCVLFYIVFSRELGFLLTSGLMLTALLLITRGLSRVPSNLVIALAVTATMYVLFAKVLRVPLPFGVIESWLVG